MSQLALLSPTRRRNRAVWADPVRKLRTLEAFARTEADGGKDIAAAARRVTDPELRQHLLRHAEDEVRHADLFHRRAAELREAGGTTLVATEDANAYDLSRGRPASEVDAHGFFNVGLIDDMGDVAYVAMLNIAEKNAASLFTMHRDLLWDDAETRAIFEDILKDEKYHVAYTGTILEKWKKDGRVAEVKAAMTTAKGSRILGAMKRAGIRMGAHFGRTLMLVLYYTLLAPIGFLASRGRSPAGWQDVDAPASDPLAGARSQY
jgi:rubrerythrin